MPPYAPKSKCEILAEINATFNYASKRDLASAGESFAKFLKAFDAFNAAAEEAI